MKTQEKAFDTVGYIIEFESGQLGDAGTIKLFSQLLKTEQAWSLQGSYGRAATALIDGGYLLRDGTVTDKGASL